MMAMRLSEYSKLSHSSINARVCKGFTLIEMMAVIAILGILLAIATPSFKVYFEKYRAKRAAESMNAFLFNAKSEAIKRNKKVYAVFKVSNGEATWCGGLVVDPTTTCDCTANSCQIDSADRIISSSDFKGVLLREPDNDDVIEFKPARGTTTSDTVEVESASGQQIRVVLSGRGRIMLCSPSGANNMGGYPTCP